MPEVQRSSESGETTQLFIQFVMMQQQQALLALGRHPQSGPGGPRENLALAKIFIDQMAMIRGKTTGNLNPHEQETLDEILQSLEKVYAETLEERRARTAGERRNPAPGGGEPAFLLPSGEQSSLPVVKESVLSIGSCTLGGTEPLFILGPCVMESEEFVWDMARRLKVICGAARAQFVFKASYDKANRTSIKAYRGLGADEGCRILAGIGRELKIPVTTDVHSPVEAETAAASIDILQIPAFLCRQTDLIAAAARTGRVVNVKKGQFLAPWDVKNIAEKLIVFGCERFFFTERGASFGYNNLVADMRSLY